MNISRDIRFLRGWLLLVCATIVLMVGVGGGQSGPPYAGSDEDMDGDEEKEEDGVYRYY